MHLFDYQNKPADYLTPEIVNLISTIREHKGRQDLFAEAHADELETLLQVAKIQSVGASNRIEGISTTDRRIREIVLDKSEPRNRSEEEIAGYREVLSLIHENYDHIPIQPNIILQLHRDLYSFSSSSMGGIYKKTDNLIAELDAQGRTLIRFEPTPAHLAPGQMEELCAAYEKAIQANRHDPLILTAIFILDFLCIHPFNDGNGRMSRLLTLLMLYRTGFWVGKYISLETLTEATKDSYYDALQSSSRHWKENKNTYEPFLRYFLGILIKAYREFEDRVEHLIHRKGSKADRVKAVFDRKLGKITKQEILTLLPDISQSTVERALANMVKEGYIRKVDAGPATGYVRENEGQDG
ncbi:MAG: Fic family protein [Bacteroidales bacterium]|nr:Fic family protein [Bacteroidales bacterium]